MGTRWAAVITLGLLASCGFPTQNGPSRAVEEQPASLITEPEGGRPTLEPVTLWFVRDDQLAPITRRVPAPTDVASVLSVLVAGVSKTEGELGVRSAIPAPEMVVDAELSAGRADVRLSADFLDIPAGDQVMALGQIVYTLTDMRGVGRVRFIIDDAPVVIPLPSGDSTEDSVSRDDFVALTAP